MTNITEDRQEIFNILKAFVSKQHNADKLIYRHVSYKNIEGTTYSVCDYEDELYFTKSGRLWLSRRTETFTSDFEKESMENVKRRVSQGCVKAEDYMKEICSFPLNGELTIIKQEQVGKRNFN